MKKLTLLILLFLPLSTFAQQNFNQANMQQMMQQAEKMQECMKNIDQSALQSISERAQLMEKEVQSLCNAGKRDTAMQRALKFANEIQGNKEMIKIGKCGEMMQGIVPEMQMPTIEEMKKHHICDID
jgi:Ni,Fe-hydrogenase I large subunit